MRELTLAANQVRALLDLAVSRGAGRQTLLARSGIDPTDLENRDNRIAFSNYVALMKAGQELLNDPALALHFGEAVDVTELSLACAMGGFANIDNAFAQVNRYARLSVEVEEVGNGDRFRLKRTAGQLWIADARRNPNVFPELTESSFARMVTSTRRSLGDMQIFQEIHFTHHEPVYRAEYERIFRVPLTFGSRMNAIRVDESVIAKYRPAPPAPLATAVLRDHADALLKQLDDMQSTRRRVERVLLPMLKSGRVSVEAVSSRLGVSRQTLFRKLRAEEVTYERVLDELRQRLALHYLTASKASVNQTASLVGYSDTTAFSRAFKRWTGSSPRTFAARQSL